jgi:cobaltochelatase CobS
MNKMDLDIANMPDTSVDVRKVFGIDVDMKVPAYSEADAYVPEIDRDYIFDRDTTLAILAGFAHNRRVMISGLSRHRQVDPYRAGRRAPQLALRARQPRQPHVSRIDLVGKDAIVIHDGKQVTEFRDGILPWALPAQCRTLVFDEYDAGRPDVMFVIQRVLESTAS